MTKIFQSLPGGLQTTGYCYSKKYSYVLLLFAFSIDVPQKMLFNTSTKCMIKWNDCLYLFNTILCQRQPSIKQRLLSGEHFKVSGWGVLHKQFWFFGCALKVGHLFLIKTDTLLGSLPSCKSVIHLISGIEQRLFKPQSSFLPRLCCRMTAVSLAV